MKNKSVIIGIVVAVIIAAVVAIFIITGNNNGNNQTNNNGNASQENGNNEQVSEKSKGNYDVFESINKLESDLTLEEMNQLMGFDATVKNDKGTGWKSYEWKLTDKTSIEVLITDSTKKGSFTAYFPNEMIKNDKADFSNVKDFKKQINSAEGVKYEDFVKSIGCEGTVDKKDSSSIGYLWVNSNGGTLHATFSLKSGKCTIFNGVF